MIVIFFVIGWFRSTSPDPEVVSALPLRYNDSVALLHILNADPPFGWVGIFEYVK
jgi:hypothetical protein